MNQYLITAIEFLAAVLDGLSPGNPNLRYARISLQKAKEEMTAPAAPTPQAAAQTAAFAEAPLAAVPGLSTAAPSTPPASEAVEHE